MIFKNLFQYTFLYSSLLLFPSCGPPLSSIDSDKEIFKIIERFSNLNNLACLKGQRLERVKIINLGMAQGNNRFGISDSSQIRSTISFSYDKHNNIHLTNIIFDDKVQKAINNKKFKDVGLVPDGEVYKSFSITGWKISNKTALCMAGEITNDLAPTVFVDAIRSEE